MRKDFTPENALVLVGCGHMGRAMAQGWLKAGLDPKALFIADPVARQGSVDSVPAANYIPSLDLMPSGTQVRAVVVAVKPQIMDKVLPSLTGVINGATLIISIAAGVTLAQMARGVGADAVYVRAMPNTPAAVGAGITGVTAGPSISDADKILARELLTATGPTVWISDEDQMNAVTAVSGSGPAYVFHLVECMAAAGARQGLPEDVAMQLARQTIVGAARLMEAEADVSAADLRRRVTSPGGTTAAALEVIMHTGGMPDLMLKAVEAATKRGEELAG
jgi:pyrroline-5-carboxylate reductase